MLSTSRIAKYSVCVNVFLFLGFYIREIRDFVISIYLDKLAYEQVVNNCRYSIAQMCICEDIALNLGVPSLDDVMSHNELTIMT